MTDYLPMPDVAARVSASPEDLRLYDLVEEIDSSTDADVTDWEAEFLDSCLKRGRGQRFSAKQREVIERMAECYL